MLVETNGNGDGQDHTLGYLGTVSKRIVINARLHSPTTMKPMNTEAGPPVWNAPAEPTNRPAPIAPPLIF
jgi:hypothetical protein